MSSKRINLHHRDTITIRAIAHKYEPLVEAINSRKNNLAIKAYNIIVPQKTQDELAFVDQKFLTMSKFLYFQFGSYKGCLPVKTPLATFYGMASNYTQHPIILNGELCQEFEYIMQDEEKLKKQKKIDEHAMLAFLGGYSTFSMLLKDWPEGKKFYESFLADDAVNLPAPRIQAINDAFGLPDPEDMKEAA